MLVLKIKKQIIPFFNGEVVPSNLVTFDQDLIGPGKEIEIKSLFDNKKLITVLIDKKNQKRDFFGILYAAIGLKPNTKITSNISKDNLLVYPYNAEVDWFAPNEIPIGSLMESTLRWAVATQNLSWAFETHCYHENYFIEILTSHMENNGINLPLSFFDILRSKMLEFYEAQADKFFKKLPNDEETIKIYKNCFQQVYYEPANKFFLKKFENCLREILDLRISKYRDCNLKIR